MKAEKIVQEQSSRTLQNKRNNSAAAQFMDNRSSQILQAVSNTTVQRVEDEEDAIQGKFDTVAQRELDEEEPIQQKPNNTGMPDSLKAGVESLSGYSMDNVRVHYNSDKPAAVQAHAYTQGQDIHVAPGQEQHLPHEAWHVTQQMAGRVEPTTEVSGMPVNDNMGLEHEADIMGARANNCVLQAKITNREVKNSVLIQRQVPTPDNVDPHPNPNTGGVYTAREDGAIFDKDVHKRSIFTFGKNIRNAVLRMYEPSVIGNRIVAVRDQSSGQMVNVESIQLDHKISWHNIESTMHKHNWIDNKTNKYDLREARMYYNDIDNLHPVLAGLNAAAGSRGVSKLSQGNKDINCKMMNVQVNWMNLQNYICGMINENPAFDIDDEATNNINVTLDNILGDFNGFNSFLENNESDESIV